MATNCHMPKMRLDLVESRLDGVKVGGVDALFPARVGINKKIASALVTEAMAEPDELDRSENFRALLEAVESARLVNAEAWTAVRAPDETIVREQDRRHPINKWRRQMNDSSRSLDSWTQASP